MNGVRGYKVFDPDWTCRGKKYTCPGTFEEDVELGVCKRGMHFCKKLFSCFYYYDFDPNNKVAEVVAYGKVITEGNKSVTNKLEIVRELSWKEVLDLVNIGEMCSGKCNSGYYNSGDYNSGNYNIGSHNSGNYNGGNWNSGSQNSGKCNSGDHNSGNYNSGCGNSGDCNSGFANSGHYNSGYHNSGDYNSGNYNSGSYNSGSYNIGHANSGDHNSGNCNSGDWNRCNFSNGCFNTEEPKIYLFNRPTDWTYRDWIYSAAKKIMEGIPSYPTEYVLSRDMTNKEKAEHPEAEITGGYLKESYDPIKVQDWWNNLPEEDRKAVKSLPNFDAKIFKEFTGIEVE